MITMLLGGLWHGANWTFVVWGALHGSIYGLKNGLNRYSGPGKKISVENSAVP